MEILSKMPQSELKETLILKYKGYEGKYEKLLTELQTVSSKISMEIRNIDLLFPEYTPHDIDYHINHLFQISDKLIGKERYMKMNFMELYLLIVSIYAHDWGMAVSDDEKKCIVNREENPVFDLLERESDEFIEYLLMKKGITDITIEKLDLSIWREYVRNTHACRSGKRIKSHFKNINASVADASEKLCIGHWHNIDDINETNGYYTDDSICGSVVNLKALTIYIRLIDLFDLAEDRTPYVIWKYINPKNSYSKMEWEKHRALHEVSCPQYDSGRTILVRGSTDDYEVYASIMDLKDLCNRYFRECLDVLAHMKDSRHQLGVHFIDWRVDAVNFTPISIRFDFNRENIFGILSQEIYNFHPYVYIRELLQNSVDAITFRKKILEREGIGGDCIGKIYVEINRASDGDFFVSVKDDGIGMDKYILKNYFSVLGKSYYKSNDFEVEKLNMSPISRFGVGVLSCFSVAESMEIITVREPYAGGNNQGMKVLINDICHQFRIEEIPRHKNGIGTEIKLRIKTSKLEKQLQRKGMEVSDYDITEYIKNIAGFSPFPILIKEKDKKVIVINPYIDTEKETKILKENDDYAVYKISKDYDKSSIVLFQDERGFDELFESRSIDLKEDLKIQDKEGFLNFAKLKSNSIKLVNLSNCWPASEIMGTVSEEESYKIRWVSDNVYSRKKRDFNNHIKIYSNGFWLENECRNYYDLRSNLFPKPIVYINCIGDKQELSVSRFESMEETGFNKKVKKDDTIIDRIWYELTQFLTKELEEKKSEMEYFNYLREVVICVHNYKLKSLHFDEDFLQNIKIPFISETRKVEYFCLKNKETVRLLPKIKLEEYREYFETGKVDNIKLDNRYGECILFLESNGILKSLSNAISNFIFVVLERNYCIKGIEVHDCKNEEIPVVQEIWSRGYRDIKNEKMLKRIISLDSEICDKIEDIFDKDILSKNIVDFGSGMSGKFAFGNNYLNIENQLTINLIQYCFMINKITKKNSKDIKCAEISDLFFGLPFLGRNSNEKKKYSLSKINSQLSEIGERLKLFFPQIEICEYELTIEDFVDGTIKTDGDEFNFVRSKNNYNIFDEE